MSYSTPTGWKARCVIEDEAACHQIRLMFEPGGQRHLAVSCTCRATGLHNSTGPSYMPLRRVADAADALAAHRQHLDSIAAEFARRINAAEVIA